MYVFKKSIITRMGPENKPDPYLIRWTIFACSLFTIKLHKIIASDDDCMHDHPWTFISFILWGGYVEQTPAGKRLYHPGCILFRPAKSIHRLEVYPSALTLVITFRRVKEWGFFTRYGWVIWYRYSKQNHCD